MRRDFRPGHWQYRVELVGIDLRQRLHLVGPQRELIAGKHRDLADFVRYLERCELWDVDDRRVGSDPRIQKCLDRELRGVGDVAAEDDPQLAGVAFALQFPATNIGTLHRLQAVGGRQ